MYIYIYIQLILCITCIREYRPSICFLVRRGEAGVVPDFAALKGLLSPLPPAPLVGPGNVPIFEAWSLHDAWPRAHVFRPCCEGLGNGVLVKFSVKHLCAV